MLGLSRTPVREALTRLVGSGLVESKPGVYTRVATLNHDDVAANLAVLRVLDSLAMQAAVPRLTNRDFQSMREANKKFARAVKSLNVPEALAADDAFHHVIMEAAGNPVIARIIGQLHPQLHRILYRKFSALLGGQAAAAMSGEHWSRLGELISRLFDSDELSV
jgi:DNA-binding GntR family transcriptional regulator